MSNALVFGATGSTGCFFIDHIKSANDWKDIFIVVRQKRPEWAELANDPRFHFLETPHIMDKQAIFNDLLKGAKVDAVFNFLGGHVSDGEGSFRNTDLNFVIASARIAEELGAKQFHTISAEGADSKSMFLYWRVKGECLEELKKIQLPIVYVYKPGVIQERKDATLGEKIFGLVPFIHKLKCTDLANAVLKNASKAATQAGDLPNGYHEFTNNEILEL